MVIMQYVYSIDRSSRMRMELDGVIVNPRKSVAAASILQMQCHGMQQRSSSWLVALGWPVSWQPYNNQRCNTDQKLWVKKNMPRQGSLLTSAMISLHSSAVADDGSFKEQSGYPRILKAAKRLKILWEHNWQTKIDFSIE